MMPPRTSRHLVGDGKRAVGNGKPDVGNGKPAVGKSGGEKNTEKPSPQSSSKVLSSQLRMGPHLTVIADSLPVVVSYVDASQRYRFMNRTFERWFAQPAERVLGRSMREVLGEAIYEKIQEPLLRALAGKTVRTEFRAHLPVLGERDLEMTFTPDFGPDGTVQGTVNMVTDITDRARLVAELAEANAETDALYELTDAVNRAESLEGVYAPALAAFVEQMQLQRCALLLFDPDGVLRFRAWRGLSDEYRRAAEGQSPWPADERNAAPLIVPDVRKATELAKYLPAFEAEKIRALAFLPLEHGGRLLGTFTVYSDDACHLSAGAIRQAQAIADQVAAAVGQKQNKAEREHLIEQLTHTVQVNEFLAGTLSHDLRNPLGAMLMSATVLSRRLTDPSLLRATGRILTAGQRMNRMISQLLDFTRVKATGTLPIERSRADLSVVFRQAIEELSPVAAAASVDLSCQGDARGCWDADRLAQVASNLLTNAVRHGAPDEAIVVRIDGSDPDWVSASVTNSGTIADNLIPAIFQPFQNGEFRDRKGGLGLGLFIGREIAAAHGGTMQLQRTQERTKETTTFTVRLPREVSERPRTEQGI